MIRYKLKWGIQIFLMATPNDEVASIEYEGNRELGEIILGKLARCYGAFGHSIGNRCTPPDLAAAMNSPAMQAYNPQLVEGADLVQAVPNIPDGALT